MLPYSFWAWFGNNKKNHKSVDGLEWRIYNNLANIFMGAYEWVNMPESVDTRYLNESLLYGGRVAFFKNELLGKSPQFNDDYFCLRLAIGGSHDIYFNPTKVSAIGGSGTRIPLTNDVDCVIIYHNDVRDIPQMRLWDFAERIAHIERTIDVNIQGQKTPYIIGVNQKNKFSVRKIFEKMFDYKEAIFVDNDGLDKDSLAVFPTVAPFVSADLQKLKRDVINECMAYIGIESNMSEKNERLLAGELFVSNGLAIANRGAMLKTRREACKKINKMFNLNVGVIASNPSILDSIGEETTDATEIDGSEIDVNDTGGDPIE